MRTISRVENRLKEFLACTYAEGRQTPRRTIQIVNGFLASNEILCNRDLYNSFTFLRVHPLSYDSTSIRHNILRIYCHLAKRDKRLFVLTLITYCWAVKVKFLPPRLTDTLGIESIFEQSTMY